MGTRHLHEILSERQTISGTMQVIFAAPTLSIFTLEKEKTENAFQFHKHESIHFERVSNEL